MQTPLNESSPSIKLDVRGLNFFYDQFQALKNVSLAFPTNKITALIGPSGCGKTTLLRCFNRMHELYEGTRHGGQVILMPSGIDVLAKDIDPIEVRKVLAMVFQKPNPFPRSIFENIAYGLRLRGHTGSNELKDRVEGALKGAGLWNEVSDRLHSNAQDLSGGQQQRLCIARAIAVEPEILLFDEPTSALDPLATGIIEELMVDLKKKVTIIIVTHNMQQAMRTADHTAFLYMGELIEFGTTKQIFQNPKQSLTDEYVQGRFG